MNDSITQQVLDFYQAMPFNVRKSVSEAAKNVRNHDPALSYPPLRELIGSREILEVGCGVGWFTNGMAYHHQVEITAIDLNPVAIQTAKSVARRLRIRPSFEVANLFEYVPSKKFELVASLGVLHHTSNCEAAIRRVCQRFLAEDGVFMLGLYHHYGRRPFLELFRSMQLNGATELEMFQRFLELYGKSHDKPHVYSWFRDQVLHPHETQHTYAELRAILRSEGLRITSTSLNRFLPQEEDEIETAEKEIENLAKQAIQAGRFYPGFFVVFAERKL